ncbi:flagellar biosynthesis protein FlhB [Rubrivivax rivuli]|uniref:Flagellar biosynthetic protein FlhB n=1 Tax=Rubrivivax rivuli TaxID=1862385 RepID=A0A437RHU9_9BURK|nr:flagellar biosynthesis protein FlhB [Rubrivivax rivuli]RVU46295.1 flagellar biosynthesis protein FlhB [Rubrivivax rivuli]
MSDDNQDRQLPATERKLKKAREEGQVARSRDLGHFAALGGAVALLAALAPVLSNWMSELVTQGLRFDAANVQNPSRMLERLGEQTLSMLVVLVPLFGVMAAVALASGLLAGGWNFSMKALEPKFDKINPISGLGRVFSVDQMTQTLKASFLSLLLGVLGGVYLWMHWYEHATLLAQPLATALGSAGTLMRNGLLMMVGLLAAFAIVDVPLQRFMLARRLRMSVQELKQEHKETEGNAELKSRMRMKMRELASRRMLAAVPEADLVVMNPTHFAVALKYDESKMGAPRVVAKGADLLAFKIRDIAKDHKVPVLQAPPLARALYAHTEVDQEIPARLFSAVAQVLAWVYQVRDAAAHGRMAAAAAPTPEVPPELDPLNPAYAAAKARKFNKQEPEL